MVAKKTIVVIGGAHGGPCAAARARQANENARIILIEQAPNVCWVQASARLFLSSEEQVIAQFNEKESYFQKRYNIELRVNTRALALDLDARLVLIECNSRTERIAFDSLIFAGGAINKKLDIAGLSGSRVMHFRNMFDIAKIKKAIAEGVKNAVVVGCGFFGMDAALGLRALGLDVTILEKKKRIMPHFSTTFAEAMVNKINEQGIKLKLGVSLSGAVERPEKGFDLSLSDNTQMLADLVVVCIGISPRTELLAEAGAAMDPEGLIRVDDHMSTTLPNVFACGSAISVPHAITNERKWIPQPATILRTAHVAGFNAASNNSESFDSLKPFCGTVVAEVGDTVFARTGLQEHEARLLFGDDAIFSTTVFGSAEDSFEYKHEMCVKLLVDKIKGRVIGGEVFGQKGVLRRIDLISVAVLEGWSPQKLIDLDMAYLANSGPVFDPLKDAAMRAESALLEHDGSLTPEHLALWLANNRDFRLVDVGESAALSGRNGHRVLHLPLESLRSRLEELEGSDTPIVLYSKSGHRSYLAQSALKQRGLANVYHLDGGIAIWNLLTPR